MKTADIMGLLRDVQARHGQRIKIETGANVITCRTCAQMRAHDRILFEALNEEVLERKLRALAKADVMPTPRGI